MAWFHYPNPWRWVLLSLDVFVVAYTLISCLVAGSHIVGMLRLRKEYAIAARCRSSTRPLLWESFAGWRVDALGPVFGATHRGWGREGVTINIKRVGNMDVSAHGFILDSVLQILQPQSDLQEAKVVCQTRSGK